MPSVKKVGSKVQVEIERFDGGLNTKDSPSRVDPLESPDCLNVVYDDQGSVSTREGTSYFSTHTAKIGTNVVDGQVTYNDSTMIVWAGGQMLRSSGATLVTIPSAQGQFSSGTKVAYAEYQGLLFCSDGTNGPYKYDGSEFYQMGIAVPSAPTSLSDAAGDIAADTYYYAVSYVNTQAVEGEVGSACTGVAIGASSTIKVDDIPVGAASLGVNQRFVYRATSPTGPWLFVKTLTGNTDTSLTDTVGVGSEGGEPPDDATAPTPFNTIRLHKERLFFDDNDNDSDVRYTEFQNPFVSKALNFEPLDQGDGSALQAIAVQDDLLTCLKDNSIWVLSLNDPSDDLSWQKVKTPANQGILSRRGFVETNNGLFFAGKRNGYATGFHILAGIQIIETADGKLRTESVSEKIEKNVLAWPTTVYADVAMFSFANRIYIAGPRNASSTINDAIWWFDINRLGSKGQPGSWSLWTGDVGVTDFSMLNNKLYGGSSSEDGNIIQFENGTYTDATGIGIDSYMWTKEIGGEASIESWIKDWRYTNLWYELLGSYNMSLRWRTDGQSGIGTGKNIDLTPGGTLWNGTTWNGATWGTAQTNKETQHNLGRTAARRIQFRFDNQYNASDTSANAGQGFKVHSQKTLCNLRRQR